MSESIHFQGNSAAADRMNMPAGRGGVVYIVQRLTRVQIRVPSRVRGDPRTGENLEKIG